MKILRLATFLDFGGVETRLANVSHVQDDNDWVFVCLNREGQAAETIRSNHKKVINLQAKASIYSFRTLLKVYRMLLKEKPDVIHTSGAEANFHGILAAKMAGIPVIIGEEIGIPSHSKKAQLIFSRIYSLAHFVVGNSQAVLNAVHLYDQVPKSKLVKIDNPIIFKDLSKYQRINIQDKAPFRILMISRLEPVKNIEGVIQVVNRLIQEGIEVNLTIAGNGAEEKQLKEEVTNLNISQFVNFTGFVADPYPLLFNADLYVLNSHTEGFSNSLVEAMYSKTPSLSTSVGAAPEIIADNENGFLTPSADDEALYTKLKDIMALSAEKRAEIAEKGHTKIVNNFSLDNHTAELMKLYRK